VPAPGVVPEPLDATGHDAVVRAAIDAATRAILDQEEELTRLDQVVGDGDLGTALARGARAWEAQPVDGSAAEQLRRLSEYARRDIGGTSGPLYAVGLLRAAESLASGASWPDAFAAGVDGVRDLGGASVGDRTMVDALQPAAEAAPDGLDAVVDAAQRGADSTRALLARRGRSSYLGDRVEGHPDPGAVAVTGWLAAVRDALRR
jgi:dihydroxyacetone kinase